MPRDTELANPAPLGLIGFALTTFVIGLIESGWLTSEGAIHTLIPLAMAYGGTIQLFAGLLAFRTGNTFETTGFCTYGAYWWWWGLTELFAANGILDPSGTANGVVLVGFGVITTYLWFSTFNLNWALWFVFLTLALTFYFVGFGTWLGLSWGNVVGGYVAMVTSLAAAYVSFAEVTNWTFADSKLPLGGTPFGGSSASSASSSD
ncbi:acetate uptake transporter [Halogeometricum sp. S1BR25-6]|uniref:Acetate uptake transporter n=1 Tax=Halogeometricum salsisoli TaxID=2950536 RepID=A0ABU2GBP6_9EURY|nr:acetate uptake transporter [Halogeometricum sp. S1BR25-6]MDS0298207.1 acetate uptake transporter [Halogeometricum sp. S1BR25-6]